MKAISAKALTLSNIVSPPTNVTGHHWLGHVYLSLQALSSMPESAQMPRRHRDYEDSSGSCNSSRTSCSNTDEEEESTNDLQEKKVSIEVGESRQKTSERSSKSVKEIILLLVLIRGQFGQSPLCCTHSPSFMSQPSIGNHSLDAFYTTMKAS